MRLRVGLLLCLIAAIAVLGCRKPLAPNIDRNKAPETWITAAPFDTITLAPGPVRPKPHDIPVRFHVYWAGADQDGAVVGYYWAVMETLPKGSEGGPPPALPGPRPRDYHYTTRTDTTFIFTVAEEVPDRQHAFFLYAVDNQGKPDPTPARFIFNANNRYPPIAVFDPGTQARGIVYYFDRQGALQHELRTYALSDTADADPLNPTVPRDTVPSGSRLTFRFHGEVRIAGSEIKGFRYKLDESELQPVGHETYFRGNLIEYGVPVEDADPARAGADTAAIAPGTKIFRLRAVDLANGNRIPDPTRRFQMNFSPDTWFAGPDPNVSGFPWQEKLNGDKYALLGAQGELPPGGLPGTLLSPDSVLLMPVNRPPNRTFLEVYKDTVFLRKEFDTVHMASWVIFHNGGFDRDSPYGVKVADGIEDLLGTLFPGGPVLAKGPVNGSPVGFRSRISNFLTPSGPLSLTPQTGIYPFFDPNDVFNLPRIGGYHPMFLSGKAYALQRAEDGDGARDGRVTAGDERRIGDDPNDPYRSLVLVFYVNFPPTLQTADFAFRPSVTVVDTFRFRDWDLRLPAYDPDPYASGDPLGGPSASQTTRLRFKVTGKDATGAPLVFLDPPAKALQNKYVNRSDVSLRVPEALVTGEVTITVELCDCEFCELYPGTGRCISRDIKVYYVAPSPSPTTAYTSRPGLD